jgi:hypothetical protein
LRDVSFSAPKFGNFSDERAAPRRRDAAPKPASMSFGAPKKRRSVLARVFAPRRLGMLLLLGIGALAVVGVPMNALYFQDGRHPAPLFSARPPVAEEAMAPETPAPPTRTAHINGDALKPATAKADAPTRGSKTSKTDAAALKAEIAKAEPATAPAKPERKREAASRDPISRDPINAILGEGAAASPESRIPDKSVLNAQRALQRLGYVVKPDGVMGGGTRQAIEKFERDNGLPVKGELSAKVVKLLSTQAAAPRQ